MDTQQRIAIVGGGPSGALAGELLARAGRSVLLFDEKLAWEKPCGGGLTHRALAQYPFLAAADSRHNPVSHCELIGPSGQRVRFHLEYPVAIFSRFALNELLLDRARIAGVDLHKERVTAISGSNGNWSLTTPQGEYHAPQLILAAGARNPFRRQFVPPFGPDDLMVTAGYFIPGHSSLMQIQFLADISGYIWAFPRMDHASVGIAAKMGENTTGDLRHKLERWIETNGFSLEAAHFYSHLLPALRARTLDTLAVCGEGWALIGDSAGLVDPITGEGLYYALRSAELCAAALLTGRAAEYQTKVGEELLPELRLAARVAQRFYRGQVFDESIAERLVSLTAQSDGFRKLMSDYFAGIQGYHDLGARLYRILPSLMAERLAGALRLPWAGPGLAAHPSAD